MGSRCWSANGSGSGVGSANANGAVGFGDAVVAVMVLGTATAAVGVALAAGVPGGSNSAAADAGEVGMSAPDHGSGSAAVKSTRFVRRTRGGFLRGGGFAGGSSGVGIAPLDRRVVAVDMPLGLVGPEGC